MLATGRAGAEGVAISLVSADEAEYVRGIEKLLGMPLPSMTIEGFEPTKGPVGGGNKKQGENRGRNNGGRPQGNRNGGGNRSGGNSGGGNRNFRRTPRNNNNGGGSRD